jgi:H/ACA ribonucleoprotein complex subunit 3
VQLISWIRTKVLLSLIESKMRHILKCQKCGGYSLKDKCKCGCKSIMVKPPKYSPEDKYASYRRQAKEEQWKKADLI